MGSLVRSSQAVVAIVIYSVSLAVCEVELSHPSSPHPKDMYVVRATVYQVGIITNKTDHKTDKQQGHQESITFYNRNGSGIDLNGISNPLVTNVTAQSIVGLSPVDNVNQTRVLPWNALEKLASTQTTNTSDEQPSKQLWRSRREVRELPATLVKGAAVLPPRAAYSPSPSPSYCFKQQSLPYPSTDSKHLYSTLR